MGKNKSTPMTPKAAARIQSAGATSTNSKTSKTSFAQRVQSAGDKNAAKGKQKG